MQEIKTNSATAHREWEGNYTAWSHLLHPRNIKNYKCAKSLECPTRTVRKPSAQRDGLPGEVALSCPGSRVPSPALPPAALPGCSSRSPCPCNPEAHWQPAAHFCAPTISRQRAKAGHAATPPWSILPSRPEPALAAAQLPQLGQRLRAPVTSAASTAPHSTPLQQGRISHRWQQLAEPCSHFTPRCRPRRAAGCRSQDPAEPFSCQTAPRSSSLHL